MKLNMKKLKQLTHYGIVCAVMSLCAAGLPSCSDDYDDTDIRKEIQDVKDRVAKLEEWQKTVNSDITSIKGLVEALQQKNFITDVTPVTEGGEEIGYTITFQTGKSITIKNGVNGKTPIIGVAKEGDTYYWTIKTGDADAVFMTDAEGNKMPVTGHRGEDGADAVAPQVRINTESNEWELSTDGGETWTGTGVKATGANGEDGEKGDKGDKGDRGDAIFAENGIDTESDPDNVIFTLADGTTLTVPKAQQLSVGFENYDVITIAQNTNEIKIVLPSSLQETDFVALAAEVRSETGTGTDIHTKAGSPWKVTVTAPTFTDDKYDDNAKVKIEAAGVSNGEKAILKVTLITGNGKEISASRVFEYFNGVIVEVAQTGGLEAALEGVAVADFKGLRVMGTIGEDDFTFIKEKLTSLECLDIADTDLTELPYKALAFYGATNNTLKEIVLPKSLTKIGNCAFAMCRALEKLTLPSAVRELGGWMLEGCKKLTSINIPAGVTEFPEHCFFDAGLTSIDIPATVTTIGNDAFANCPLKSVVIPSSVTSLGAPRDPLYGNNTFSCSGYFDGHKNDAQLQSVVIEANVTVIPVACFAYQEKLESVTISNSVTRIEADAFYGCPINSVILPESLQFIGARAFSESKFTEITIPSKVKQIDNFAFNFCKISTIDLPASIESVHATAFNWAEATIVICRAEKVPATPLYDDNSRKEFPPFYQLKKGSCKLKVPAASLDAYKTAWGEYFGEENIESL